MKKLVLKKKYSNYLKIVLILIIIISLINVTYRKYEEHILKKEMNTLIEQDLTKNSFNTSSKTIGNYQIVEQSMKRYLSDYSTKAKKVLSIINDERLKSILSAQNYRQDGPTFITTLAYLETTQQEFSQEMTNLIKLTNKKTIEIYMDKSLPNYYQKVYKSYMLEDLFQQEIKKNTEDLKKSYDNINQLIEQEREVVNFLITCKTWTVKEDKIIFSKEEDLVTYNTMISKLS